MKLREVGVKFGLGFYTTVVYISDWVVLSIWVKNLFHIEEILKDTEYLGFYGTLILCLVSVLCGVATYICLNVFIKGSDE